MSFWMYKVTKAITQCCVIMLETSLLPAYYIYIYIYIYYIADIILQYIIL